MSNTHIIDYKIIGSDLQAVLIGLDPGETCIAEAGNFLYMEDGIVMETTLSSTNEGFGRKLLGVGKRLMSGESLFMTAFTNEHNEFKKVAFAAPYPGKIIPLDLKEYGGKILCQRSAYLCSAKGVEIGIEFSKKVTAGLWGGEGVYFQKLEGDGLAFVHAGGGIIKRTLGPNEVLRLETGALVAMTQDVEFSVELVRGVKSIAFSGNGLFNTVVRGSASGDSVVWIQTMPFDQLAGRIVANAPQTEDL